MRDSKVVTDRLTGKTKFRTGGIFRNKVFLQVQILVYLGEGRYTHKWRDCTPKELNKLRTMRVLKNLKGKKI
jgi:hypothetical protein